MSKGGTIRQQSIVDPATQRYFRSLRQNATGTGIPATEDAASGLRRLQAAGNLGIGALTGEGPNPFMNQYLDALNPIYDQIRSQSLGSIGDSAQMAGAFGGSRQGVAEGVALGQIGQQQAGANIDAFNQAQERALALANLGFGASQGLGALGTGLLGQGTQPLGQQTDIPYFNDPLGQLLGLGATYFGARR